MGKFKYSDIVAFFEDLATRHKKIMHTPLQKHFFRHELNDIITNLPSGMHYPAMLLSENTFSLVDNNADNVAKMRDCSFMLLGFVSDPGSMTQAVQVFDEMEEIGDDMLTAIKRARHLPDSPMRNFKYNSVSVTPVFLGKFPNCIGLHYAFELETWFDTQYKPENWLNETS